MDDKTGSNIVAPGELISTYSFRWFFW